MVTHPGALAVALKAGLIRMPEMFNNTLRKLPLGGTPTNATATLAVVGAGVAVELPPPPPHPEGMTKPHNAIRGGSSEKTIHHGR